MRMQCLRKLSVGKESACNVGDLGSIPGLGRSPGEGNGYLFQYSGLVFISKLGRFSCRWVCECRVYGNFTLYLLLISLLKPMSLASPATLTWETYLFFFFNWRLITLQYCSGFCHTLTWISHGCTCVPHPEPPAYLPPYPIPLGHPSVPALSILSHASNLDWRSISHMVIYMFQCYSLKLSHPRLLPQESKSLFFTSVYLAVLLIGSFLGNISRGRFSFLTHVA